MWMFRAPRTSKESFKESVLIFVLPPSLQVLEKRLKERGTDDKAALEKRIEKASREIGNCVWYDYLDFQRCFGGSGAGGEFHHHR